MPIRSIKKRDGRVVSFDAGRIKNAIQRAFIAVELGDGEKATEVTQEVVQLLEKRFRERTPSVEDAQDFVIDVLNRSGYRRVAEEYATYRKKKGEIRVLRKTLGIEDPKLTVNALEVLKQRYLLKSEKGQTIETPVQLFKRIAKAVSSVEQKNDRLERSREDFL